MVRQEVRAASLGEIKRTFDDFAEIGSGLVGTTSWKRGVTQRKNMLKGDTNEGRVTSVMVKLKTVTAKGEHF